MADKKISQLDSASSITNGAVFPLSQSGSTYKGTIDQISEYVAGVKQYNDLDTNAKTLIEAINEAAQSGSVEMEQTVTTPVSIASITDGGDNIPAKSLKVLVSAVQSGNGTPSPSNIRSISGWSGAKVGACGSNIWNEEWEQGVYNSSGNKEANTNAIRAKNPIPVKSGESYVIVGLSGNRVCYYDKAGVFVSTATNQTVITIPNNVFFMTFSTGTSYGGSYNNDISINYPSTDTTYHAYKGTTHTIPFGQTVYGGVLDVKSGELTITHGIVDMGAENWTRVSVDSQYYVYYFVPSDKDSTFDFICSCFNAVAKTRQSLSDLEIGTYNSTNAMNRLCVRYDAITTEAAFKTAVTGQSVIYKLATPTKLYLTPTQVKTLLGTCNIFADTGDIDTLIYFNSNADEVADVVEAYVGEVVNLYATLATGNTSVTISSSAIHTNSTIDIYTDNDVDYISAVVTEGQIVITFEAQQSNLGVKVRVS